MLTLKKIYNFLGKFITFGGQSSIQVGLCTICQIHQKKSWHGSDPPLFGNAKILRAPIIPIGPDVPYRLRFNTVYCRKNYPCPRIPIQIPFYCQIGKYEERYWMLPCKLKCKKSNLKVQMQNKSQVPKFISKKQMPKYKR